MTSMEDELTFVEALLKKYAQEVGELNLTNNQVICFSTKLQESNQQLSIDIQRLQSKISKKSHNIQQQTKDKQIIHQKLVKAQQIKEQLQIRYQKIQGRKQHEASKKQHEVEKQHQLLSKRQEIKPIPKVQNNKSSIQESKSNEKPKIHTPNQSLKQEKEILQANKAKLVAQAPFTTQKQEQKSSNIKVQQKAPIVTSAYDSSQKGDYQPPALFQDYNSSDSDGEDNSQVLQKLKQKLKQDKEELQEDD